MYSTLNIILVINLITKAIHRIVIIPFFQETREKIKRQKKVKQGIKIEKFYPEFLENVCSFLFYIF